MELFYKLLLYVIYLLDVKNQELQKMNKDF